MAQISPIAPTPLPQATFSYQAVSAEDEAVAGTIEALDLQDASRRLSSMRLRVTSLAPSGQPSRAGRRAIGASDFIAFNQQLAQLTAAGLPIEQGLRLIAQDLHRGRLRSSIQLVLSELEKGASLPEAFQRHEKVFPPLYSRLLDAGIRAGNLPGVLLNIGRHAEMVQRLRGAILRAVAYPASVLAGLVVILWLLHAYVLPQFVALYASMKPIPIYVGLRGPPVMSPAELPGITRALIRAGERLPVVLAGIAALVLLVLIGWAMLRRTHTGRTLVEGLVLHTPLIGPPLRSNLVARWCDAVRIGVDAGVDLPQSIELADDVMSSPMISSDGASFVTALYAGQALGGAPIPPKLLPATIPAAIDLAARKTDLPNVLATLSELYQRQAEIRLAVIPTVLTPLLMFIIAGIIGTVIIGLMLPLLRLFTLLGGTSL